MKLEVGDMFVNVKGPDKMIAIVLDEQTGITWDINGNHKWTWRTAREDERTLAAVGWKKGIMKTETLNERFEIILNSEHINDSTKQFVESLRKNNEKWNGLTGPQLRSLESIEKRNCPEARAENEAFRKGYDDDKRKIATICAEYYKRNATRCGTYYFQTLCDSILYKKDFVPSKKQYESMTRSSYAKRAVIAATEPHKFEAGDLVVFRKNVPYAQIDSWARRQYGDEIIILSADSGKGMEYKEYLVFQVKNPKVQFYIQERFLKKMPKSKS